MKYLVILGTLYLLYKQMATNKPLVGKSIKLTPQKVATINDIIGVLKSQGVTNKYAIAAILTICYKEGNFLPKRESSYANSSLAHIRKIFPQRSRNFSDQEIEVLKKDPVAFFNAIYSDLGGYKYRGGGYNGITGSGNYKKRGENIGVDLYNNPEKIEIPEVAAAALADYMKATINNAGADDKQRYSFTNINSFTNLQDATGAIYHANAGFGKSYDDILKDTTGGRKKAFAYTDFFYNLLQNV